MFMRYEKKVHRIDFSHLKPIINDSIDLITLSVMFVEGCKGIHDDEMMTAVSTLFAWVSKPGGDLTSLPSFVKYSTPFKVEWVFITKNTHMANNAAMCNNETLLDMLQFPWRLESLHKLIADPSPTTSRGQPTKKHKSLIILPSCFDGFYGPHEAEFYRDGMVP